MYKNFLLILSLFIMTLNGSILTFILFDVRFGSLFGFSLFCLFSLLGCLLATLHEERTFWSKYCFYGNLMICFSPLIALLMSNTIIPALLHSFIHMLMK